MVTQFSLLGLQTLHLGEQAGKLPSLQSPGPRGWAHSTWAKNQSEISGAYVGAGKALLTRRGHLLWPY